MKTVLAYLELARPLNGTIAFLSTWLGGIFASQDPVENIINPHLLLISTSTFTLLSAGNAINDYCDYDIDRINRPKRPIPSGRIPRRNALIYAVVLTLIGIALGTQIHIKAVAIILLAAITLVSYAFWLKRTPLLGNLTVAALTGLAFIAGGVALNTLRGTLIPATFAFLFTTAREIVKDLEDTEGDRQNNVRTLATLNPQLAVQTALCFMAAVILFSPLPYLLGWYSWHYLGVVLIGVDLVLIGLAIRLARDASKSSCTAIQKWMKWDIFVGLGAIYLGTFL